VLFELAVFLSLLGQQATTQPATGTAATAPQFAPDEGLERIRWEAAREHMGEEVVVVGRCIDSRTNSRGIVLYFDLPRNKSLKLFVRRESLERFQTAPDSAYPGRWVAARGLIDEFNGEPELVLTSPDQIRVLADEPKLTATTKPAAWSRETVRIGSFNVMNLFDTYDDPYTHDETTPFKPRAALEQVAATIRQLNADVLALVEVENRGVLERFNRALLSDMGYGEVVLFEGNDGRGIDVALLSRLPVGAVTTYRHLSFPLPGGGETRFRRDLLRVRIEPPGAAAFDVFVVHLKSKRGETQGSAPIRQAEATELRRICDEILKQDAAARFLVCGDFNDTWDSPALKTIRGSGATALTCAFEQLPTDKRVTYNREPHRSMIDYILCSPAMAKAYVDRSYGLVDGSTSTIGSDHNPIGAEFRVK